MTEHHSEATNYAEGFADHTPMWAMAPAHTPRPTKEARREGNTITNSSSGSLLLFLIA
jgi:hypothetical protein